MSKIRTLAAVAILALSCRPPADQAPALPSSPPAPAAANAPFDVQEIIRTARLGYRGENGAYRAAAALYEVTASRHGVTVSHALGSAAAPSLHLGPAVLRRGARQEGEVTGMRVVRQGELELSRAASTEALRNTAEGVEQSWTFTEQPSGRGELRVRVPLRGMALRAVTETGLHFTDAGTGRGFRYGHGTWIDADGIRTPVPARFVDGAIALSVPDAVLRRSRYPAVLDPLISPELGIDAPVEAPAAGSQYSSAVAFGGTNFLVAWSDNRSGSGQLLAVRVSTTGTLLDPSPLVLSPASSSNDHATAVYAAGVYLVGWEHYTATGMTILARSVTRAGAVGALVTVAEGEGIRVGPAIAGNPQGALIAWEERSTLAIHAARLTVTNGRLSAGTPAVVADHAEQALAHPAVAAGETEYLVTWMGSAASGEWDVQAARVTFLGELLDRTPIAVTTASGSQLSPSVSAVGGLYLVVWDDHRSPGALGDVYGARVNAGGEVLDGDGIAIATSPLAESSPAVTTNGTRFFVVWEHDAFTAGDLHGSRVGIDGRVVDSPPLTLVSTPGRVFRPAVVAGSAGYLLAWDTERGGDVYATLVSGLGVPQTPGGWVVARGINEQLQAAVAFNGSAYLIVWTDTRRGGTDIFAAALSTTGELLTHPVLALTADEHPQRSPTVASNGRSFLVVWEDYRDDINPNLYGTRVSETFGVLDPEGIRVAAGLYNQDSPVASWNGDTYLVVYQSHATSLRYDILATRVSSAGAVLDAAAPRRIAATDAEERFPSVASGHGDSLVAWSSWLGVHAALVDSQARVALGPVLVSADADRPAVAFGGQQYLVAYQDHTRSEDSTSELFARIVEPAGLGLGVERRLSQGPPSAHLAAAAPHGHGFLVTWLTGNRLMGTRLHTGSAPSAFPIAEGLSFNSPPALAASGLTALVAYTREGAPAHQFSERAAVRLITTRPPVAQDQTVSMAEDTPSQVAVWASDPDALALQISLASQPQHGAVTPTADGFVYTPAPDFSGTDSFQYDVSNGLAESERATVTVQVTAVNDVPVARSQTLRTDEDTPLEITLTGEDADGDALTFAVVQPPEHGALTGTPPNLTYHPAPGYQGEDRLQFTASDEVASSTAEISLRVADVNTPPLTPELVAPAVNAQLTDGQVQFEWRDASDPDGDAVTYELQVLRGAQVVLARELAGTRLALAESEALPEGHYDWGVRAVDARGAASEPSVRSTFSISVPSRGCGCGAGGGTGPWMAALCGLWALIHRRRRPSRSPRVNARQTGPNADVLRHPQPDGRLAALTLR